MQLTSENDFNHEQFLYIQIMLCFLQNWIKSIQLKFVLIPSCLVRFLQRHVTIADLRHVLPYSLPVLYEILATALIVLIFISCVEGSEIVFIRNALPIRLLFLGHFITTGNNLSFRCNSYRDKYKPGKVRNLISSYCISLSKTQGLHRDRRNERHRQRARRDSSSPQCEMFTWQCKGRESHLCVPESKPSFIILQLNLDKLATIKSSTEAFPP